MISLGTAANLNSAVYLGPGAQLPASWREVDFIHDPASGVIMGHYAAGKLNYLAIRGAWDKTDIMPALRVFMGADPVARMMFVQDQILQRFGGDPCPTLLAVGGHSLGGLVAAAAAERFGLSGLAQNSPGWMTRQPEPERLHRFLQVRTARDVVADWGSGYPRNLMLPDPQLPDWSLSGLHNLERQNQLIDEHGIGHYKVDDHALVAPVDQVSASPATPSARFARAMEKMRAAREYTQLHTRLSGSPRP